MVPTGYFRASGAPVFFEAGREYLSDSDPALLYNRRHTIESCTIIGAS